MGIVKCWEEMKNFPKHAEFSFKEDYVVSKCSHLQLLLAKEGCFFLCHFNLSNARPPDDASSAVPGEEGMKKIRCKVRTLYEKVCLSQAVNRI